MRKIAFTLFFFWTTSNVHAQVISDLYKDKYCSAPLKVNFLQTIETHKYASSQQLTQYAWCHDESKTEKDAQNQGFNLKVVYDDLPIQADGHNDFQKALDWKVKNCASFKGESADTSATDEYKTLINEKVAEAAFAAYTACINRKSTGLDCKAIPLSGNSIAYFASYMPIRTEEKPPVVRSSAVSNAVNILENPKSKQYVFKNGTVITPAGVSATFIRSDLSKEVSFSVDLSTDVGSCPAQNVSAEEKYQVVAKMTISGFKTETRDFSSFNKAIHKNCYDGVYFTDPATPPVCPDSGFSLNETSAHIVNIRNPGMSDQIPSQFQSCFSAVAISHSMRQDGCVIPSVQVRECTRGEVGVACDDAWKDGAGWGTQYNVVVSGSRTTKITYDEVSKTFQDAISGPLELKASGVDNSLFDKQAEFTVDIIPSRGGAFELSNQKMSGSGATAFFDAARNELVITLPNPAVGGFSTSGVLDSVSDVISKLR